MPKSKRGFQILAIVAAAMIASTGNAHAAFTTTISGAPSSLQAGGHPDLTLSITFSGDEKIDDFDLNLPPGLIGNPNAVSHICTVAEARGAGCPPTSRVGTAVAQSTATLPIVGDTDAVADGEIHIMEPVGTEPARLWMKLTPKLAGLAAGPPITSESEIALRSPGDFGLTTLVRDLPDTAELTLYGKVPIRLNALSLTLAGTPPTSPRRPFLTNPSSCGNKTITIDATTKAGTKASAATEPFTIAGCDNLAFAPKLIATVGGPAKSPSFTTSVLGTDGESTLQALQLTLPPALNASLKALGRTCPQATYNAGGCAADAVIGSVRAESPLIPLPLTGPVTLVKLDGQVLPALAMKLRGAFNLDLLVQNGIAGGRLQSSITGVPDAPISRFDLNLAADGLLQSSTKALCSTPQNADGSFTAHSGKIVTSVVAVDVSAVCGVPPSTPPSTPSAGRLAATGTLRGFRAGGIPSLVVRLAGRDAKLTSLSLNTRGTRLKLVPRKARKFARGLIGGKAKRLTVKGTRLMARATSTGTASIELRLGKGALSRGTIRPGQRLTLTLTYTRAGSETVRSVKVKLRAAR